MAPPARRNELRFGDLVLAKVEGYPYWPGKISRIEDWNIEPEPNNFLVYFFGTKQIGYVNPQDIKLFTSEIKEKAPRRCFGCKRIRDMFTESMDEICKEFEELQQKKYLERNADKELVIPTSDSNVQDDNGLVVPSSDSNAQDDTGLVIPTSDTNVGDNNGLDGLELLVMASLKSDVPQDDGSKAHHTKDVPLMANDVATVTLKDGDKVKVCASGKRVLNEESFSPNKKFKGRRRRKTEEKEVIVYCRAKKKLNSASDTVANSTTKLNSGAIDEVANSTTKRIYRGKKFRRNEAANSMFHAITTIKKGLRSKRFASKKFKIATCLVEGGNVEEARNLDQGDSSSKKLDTFIHPYFKHQKNAVRHKVVIIYDSADEAENEFLQDSSVEEILVPDSSGGTEKELLEDPAVEGILVCDSIGGTEMEISNDPAVEGALVCDSIGGTENELSKDPAVEGVPVCGSTDGTTNELSENHALEGIPVCDSNGGAENELPEEPAVEREREVMSYTDLSDERRLNMALVVHASSNPERQDQLYRSTSPLSPERSVKDLLVIANAKIRETYPTYSPLTDWSLRSPPNHSPLEMVVPETPDFHMTSVDSTPVRSVRSVDSTPRIDRRSSQGAEESVVFRNSFEDIIKSMSGSKNSTHRATQLAITSAKYGVAREIIEIIIRHLENERCNRRKVDLFFLLDSITQCSRKKKGIAEECYIPAVEESLHRIIKAAAPSGESGRENRKQCTRVLLIWVRRNIFPEAFLRQFIDAVRGDGPAPLEEVQPTQSTITERENIHTNQHGSTSNGARQEKGKAIWTQFSGGSTFKPPSESTPRPPSHSPPPQPPPPQEVSPWSLSYQPPAWIATANHASQMPANIMSHAQFDYGVRRETRSLQAPAEQAGYSHGIVNGFPQMRPYWEIHAPTPPPQHLIGREIYAHVLPPQYQFGREIHAPIPPPQCQFGREMHAPIPPPQNLISNQFYFRNQENPTNQPPKMEWHALTAPQPQNLRHQFTYSPEIHRPPFSPPFSPMNHVASLEGRITTDGMNRGRPGSYQEDYHNSSSNSVFPHSPTNHVAAQERRILTDGSGGLDYHNSSSNRVLRRNHPTLPNQDFGPVASPWRCKFIPSPVYTPGRHS